MINAGTIESNNTAAGFGVWLNAGGSVSNQSGGTITGLRAIYVSSGAAGTVVNAGSIGGSGSDPGIQPRTADRSPTSPAEPSAAPGIFALAAAT